MPSIIAKKKIEDLNRVSPRDTETLIPDRTIETPLMDDRERLDYGTTTVRSSPSESTMTNPDDKPPLLNRGLMMIYLNLVSLAFLDMSHFVLLPLFYSTSIPLGGLGLDPLKIGIALGSFGFVNAIVQARLLGPLIRKFGARKLYIMCFPGLFGCITLYPIIRHFAQLYGRVNYVVVVCMIVQLSFQMFIFASYGTFLYSRLFGLFILILSPEGSIQVVLAQHATESGRIGTAIGIAQMSNAAVRTVAPALVSSLFSISLQRQLAGGNLVFYLLMGLNLLVIRLTHLLPLPPILKSSQDSR